MTTARIGSRIRMAAAATVAVLVAGCAGSAGSTNPASTRNTDPSSNTSTVAGPGPGPTSGDGPTDGISTAPDLAIDRTPGAELITVTQWEATIAGMSSRSTIRLDGDGLLGRTSDNGTVVQARIDDGSAEMLAWRVLELKDLDTGPMVTDVGGTTITLRLGGKDAVHLTMSDLPGGVGSLTPEQQQNREAVMEVVGQLSSLDGLSVVEAPTTTTGPTSGTATGTTGTTGTTTSAGATPTIPTEFEFDTSGDTPVISVSFNDYGEGGVRGVDTATVYGNGGVVRSRPDGVTTEVLDIGRLGVRDLLVRAGELDLLGPPDFGDMMVADAGSGSVELWFNDRVVQLQVEGPFVHGHSDSPENKARKAFGTFLQETLALSGVKIIDGPRTVVPEELYLEGDPGADESSSIDWPLSRPASEVFADGATATVTGDDVRALVDALDGNTDLERRNGMVALPVDTGEKVPEQLVLWIGTEKIGTSDSAPDAADPADIPWPAKNRRDATVWESWQANAALAAAADARDLPIGDPGYLDDYDFAYAVGSADGGAVIDVVATPDADHTGRDDIPPFVARVAPGAAAGAVVVEIDS